MVLRSFGSSKPFQKASFMGKNDFPRHFSANSYTQWAVLLAYGDLWNDCFDEGSMVFMSKYIWFRDNLELFSIWEAILRPKLQFSCHFYRKSWTKWSVWLTYGDVWKEWFDEGNMVFMCKYTWFRDNLDLYSIWEAIVDHKNEFLCHFLCNSEKKWWVLLTYGDIWKECFHKGNMVFISEYICFADVWTFIVFEKPSLMRKMTFHVLFLVKKFLGKNFFQQNFFCSECFNSQKNHIFEISIFHQNLNT